jgi:hypothetical protein
MDTLNELESLAQSSSLPEDPVPPKPELETIRQYMDLFDLSKEQAIEKINELGGFIPQRATSPKKSRAAAYLVKLQGPLSDAETVKSIAGLPHTPEVMAGTDDTGGEARFCRVDHAGRSKIANYFAENDLGPNPTFLQLTLANKALSHESAAPTLGRDATLPQYRADSMNTDFKPSQDEYPVWYFMYGPLTDPKELSIILRLSGQPEYHSATVTGGRFLSWNAIVDADIGQSSSESQGKAFLVQTERQEEALRFSVTDKFEVVRCSIRFTDSGKLVDGLTFRYAGSDLH